MYNDYHNKYKNVLKPLIDNTQKSCIILFKADARKLFVIQVCKSLDFKDGVCEISRKVPKSDQLFLKDQRLERKMFMGSVDLSSNTKKCRKRRRKEIYTEENQSKISGCFPNLNDSSDDSYSSKSPDIFEASTSQKRKSSQM